MSRVLFFEVEGALRNRDWFSRLAKSPDPIAAACFRAEAERLTAELERIEREKEQTNG